MSDEAILAAFNGGEAALWFVMAAAAAVPGGRLPLTTRWQRVLVVALAAFGVSDLIEMRTGAWWRPPGLLVLKGSCLAAFAAVAWRCGRRR